jgi:hypothetical protein
MICDRCKRAGKSDYNGKRVSTCAEDSRDLGTEGIVVPGRLVPVSILAIKLLEKGWVDNM